MANSRVMLIGFVGAGAIALAFLASRSNAADAVLPPEPKQPDPPPPPELPPPAPELEQPEDDDDEYPIPQAPQPSGPVPIYPPGPRVEVGPPPSDAPEPSLPPVVEPKKPFGDNPINVDAGPDNRAPVPIIVPGGPSSPPVVLPPAPIPAPPVVVAPPPPAAKPPVVVSPEPKPAPAKRAEKQAATDLLAYVTPLLKSGKGSELGVKGKPNPIVKAAQIDMGMPLKEQDGIYGPATRARGKQLLGTTFPARV